MVLREVAAYVCVSDPYLADVLRTKNESGNVPGIHLVQPIVALPPTLEIDGVSVPISVGTQQNFSIVTVRAGRDPLDELKLFSGDTTNVLLLSRGDYPLVFPVYKNSPFDSIWARIKIGKGARARLAGKELGSALWGPNGELVEQMRHELRNMTADEVRALAANAGEAEQLSRSMDIDQMSQGYRNRLRSVSLVDPFPPDLDIDMQTRKDALIVAAIAMQGVMLAHCLPPFGYVFLTAAWRAARGELPADFEYGDPRAIRAFEKVPLARREPAAERSFELIRGGLAASPSGSELNTTTLGL